MRYRLHYHRPRSLTVAYFSLHYRCSCRLQRDIQRRHRRENLCLHPASHCAHFRPARVLQTPEPPSDRCQEHDDEQTCYRIFRLHLVPESPNHQCSLRRSNLHRKCHLVSLLVFFPRNYTFWLILFNFSYLNAHTSSTPRFTTWFGSYTSSHRSTVLSHYSNLNGDPNSVTYDCSTCDMADTFAYTVDH